MPQTLSSLLAERPEAELRKMLADAQTNRARLEAEIARVGVEVDLIEEALAKQARRSLRSASRGMRSTRRGGTRDMVLDAFAETASAPTTPARVVQTVQAEGATVTAGAIRNMIGRLVEEGMVERIGEGEYKLASRNGVQPDAPPGPSENEADDPLFAGTEPREGA